MHGALVLRALVDMLLFGSGAAAPMVTPKPFSAELFIRTQPGISQPGLAFLTTLGMLLHS